MIDMEVARLRRLRNTALRARSVATALDTLAPLRGSTCSQSALTCWQIARVVTGRLRAHPYLRYQQGPTRIRGAGDRAAAGLQGLVARYRGSSRQTLCGELEHVIRELADARALTWSADLSDTFGRLQTQMHTLRAELGVRQALHRGATVRGAAGREVAGRAAVGDWPYLAF